MTGLIVPLECLFYSLVLSWLCLGGAREPQFTVESGQSARGPHSGCSSKVTVTRCFSLLKKNYSFFHSRQKRRVKTPLMLTRSPSPASIYPAVLFTGSGDKQDFFVNVFLLSLSHSPINVKKRKKLIQ